MTTANDKAASADTTEMLVSDIQKIMEIYDKNKDGKLDPAEIEAIKLEYAKTAKQYDSNRNRKLDASEQKRLERDASAHPDSHKPVILTLLKRYDKNRDGTLDDEELKQLEQDIKTTDTIARFSGYTAAFARAARYIPVRYLAYTSDFGESFRPIVPPKLVTVSYGISWMYVFGDVGYEGYKEKNRGQPDNVVANIVARRSVFQILASIVIPAIVIHSQVHLFTKIFQKIGRFQKWGPSAMGLATIPALPLVDHPVEHTVDSLFDKVWPLQKSHKHHE